MDNAINKKLKSKRKLRSGARTREDFFAAANNGGGGVEHAECVQHRQTLTDFQALTIPQFPIEKSRLC
jgi:hypothetical protein